MSSFGEKSILCRDIVVLDHWFANSLDICEYLTLRGDRCMSYNHIDSKVVDEARRVRESMVIDKCISGHIFVYKLNSSSVYIREYLCSCSNCLEFSSKQLLQGQRYSLKIVKANFTANFDKTVADLNHYGNKSSNSEDECAPHAEFENGDNQNFFDFITLPSYIVSITGNMLQTAYILKIFEKGTKIHDKYGHVILLDDLQKSGKN